jgi:hypothetical protein
VLEPVDSGPNVVLRDDPDRGHVVVLEFPYDRHLVDAVRRIPGRRFDWDARQWWAPVSDWCGAHVRELLERYPDLEPSPEVAAWLAVVGTRWIGEVTTAPHDGRGWFVCRSRAGVLPDALEAQAEHRDGVAWLPLTEEVADALQDLPGARLSGGAVRCAIALAAGRPPARATLAVEQNVTGSRLRLDPNWDPEVAAAFAALPEADGRTGTLPVDPWHAERLDAFCALHDVDVSLAALPLVDRMREEAEEAKAAVRRSRATSAEAMDDVAARLGGTLEPFQWAGVREMLHLRRAFLADEQGLGKTIQALATLEADGAWPAIVVCPASLKLNWEREAARWLPEGRSVQVLSGRGGAVPVADLSIVNYEVVGAHLEGLARLRPRALVLDESHYCKNPRAKRTSEVRRLANKIPADGLRMALSGTPVLNHAEELVAQLRILGRLDEFGSGERFSRRFEGAAEERLHWHLRRTCFVRRRKSEVLPQLPDKRRAIVPIELSNRREYAVAERDVIAWLREQPLDLRELDAQIARVLRAKRLAQLGLLKRLAARGKLKASLAWIHDFLQSGEPLVVFAHHREIQEAVIERFPEALHLLGGDDAAARDAAVTAFQDPDGPPLLVASTRVAGHGLTLTRASNVCFLELEWTPAAHDQAEDRVHRIGQHDGVTAWYLLAAETIDETISRVLARKRGTVGAITDGDGGDRTALVEAVVAELRGDTWRALRAGC